MSGEAARPLPRLGGEGDALGELRRVGAGRGPQGLDVLGGVIEKITGKTLEEAVRERVTGPLGSGKQWWAWISQVDEAAAIIHLINSPEAAGPFNLTAPEPATCGQIIGALAKQLNRPALIKVPAFALNLLIGEAAKELLLCSQKMTSTKLESTGFKFKHPDLESAARWVVKG